MLQRLPSRQAGAVAERAHRVAHQEALQGRQAVDHREPDISGEADRRDGIGKEPVEPVGGERGVLDQ